MAITINQIAELCGVSRGTVDRALHNKGNVRPAVAAQIKKVAAEYGYTPNRAGLAPRILSAWAWCCTRCRTVLCKACSNAAAAKRSG